jgi:hypothetical protein
MKIYGLLIVFWCILVFAVLAQVSDRLILSLNPNTVSLWDERMLYTLVPVLLNFGVLFLLRKVAISKFIFRVSLTTNILFFLYFFYCQYIWDVGKWKLF